MAGIQVPDGFKFQQMRGKEKMIKKLRRWCWVLMLSFGSWGALQAQDAKLAQQYFMDGEYEKAAILYDKLFATNEANTFFFDRYIDCLLQLRRYDDCEKAIARQIRKQPEETGLYVTYGRLFDQQNRTDEANEQYRRAIDKLPRERYAIIKLANAFSVLNKYDLAIATFEKGANLLNDREVFAYNLGDLYRRKGDGPKMIEQYLNSLAANPERLDNVQTIFQRYLLKEDLQELQRQLYERIQAEPNTIYYPELLTWVFLQSKDYSNAFRQVRALDRRMRENGSRVFQLASIAANDGAYDAAIEAYDYIVEQKGAESSFYLDAKRESLRCRRLRVVEGFRYTDADLKVLEEQYEAFLNEFGRNRNTASIIMEQANLEAYYLKNLAKATALLTDVIAYPGLNARLQAEAKLSLGDFLLMGGEIWEATLLYSQVDKGFPDDLMGQEARFRNARLSYYAGDFQWAQSQFDVLKASTSKLIANDALDMSVFIMDNLGLDTTAVPLELYSRADLLVFQNRFEEAFLTLDTLLQQFPEHDLQDDVWYLEAKIFHKKQQFDAEAASYEKIMKKDPKGIRADNALFALADLYEHQLGNKEKAQELYEKVFLDYASSTFAVEARKRFRILRGDKIQ